MELSTSLNVYGNRFRDYKACIFRGSRCGFRYFDFNPCDYQNGHTFYTDENWRNNIKEIKNYADSLGVTFFQSHGATNYKRPDSDSLVKKSIEAAAAAGVQWTVLHTLGVQSENAEERIEKNIVFFRPFVQFAKELGVGIAIENNPHRIYWYGERIEESGFYKADELIVLCDALNTQFSNVGICWDTGHANLAGDTQDAELLKVGKRLKATHIADNYKQFDDHMPPFFGSTDFRKIVAALNTIGYDGTLNFETHRFTAGLPDELLDPAVEFLYKIGKYTLGMLDE